MGMLRPRTGQVSVLGQAVPNRPLLAKIGFMAQTDALYESLTGAENLTFFAKMQGVPHAQIDQTNGLCCQCRQSATGLKATS